MQQRSHIEDLILASTSPYRKMLLERLGIPFEVFSPTTDETPCDGEEAAILVARLAREKAQAATMHFPSATVIGSDQVAVCNEKNFGKPGSVANAIGQLREFSGQTVHFLTAVSVLHGDTSFHFQRNVVTAVRFRQLSTEEIKRYVEMDNPVDCAGSFKSEAGGISLLSSMTSEDPSAIMGLPLIAVCEALRKAGFQMP